MALSEPHTAQHTLCLSNRREAVLPAQHTALKHLTQTDPGEQVPAIRCILHQETSCTSAAAPGSLDRKVQAYCLAVRTQSAPARACSHHRPLTKPSTLNPTRDKQETNQRQTTPAYESRVTRPADTQMLNRSNAAQQPPGITA